MRRTILFPAALVLALVGSALVVSPAAASTIDLTIRPFAEQLPLALPAGDRVHDSAGFTLSAPSAASVHARLVDAQGADAEDLGTFDLEGSFGEWSRQIGVRVDGLAPGSYSLVASDATDDSELATYPIEVTSGAAATATLSLVQSTLYPDGSPVHSDTEAQFTLADEDGRPLPVDAELIVTQDGVEHSTVLSSPHFDVDRFAFSSVGLHSGTATLQVRAEDLTSASISSNIVTITLKPVEVTSVSLGISRHTVYPVRDGYADSVDFAVSARSTFNQAFQINGTIAITRSGKSVALWHIDGSSARRTWSGFDHGKVVPGTYKITVTMQGQSGGAVTVSKYMSVSGKRLVTRTTTVDVSALTAMPEYQAYDRHARGFCKPAKGRAVSCTGYDTDNDPYDSSSLILAGSVKIPAAVVSAEGLYGKARLSAKIEVSSLHGKGVWTYAASSTGPVLVLRTGLTGTKSIALEKADRYIGVAVALRANSSATIKKVRLVYSYQKLV